MKGILALGLVLVGSLIEGRTSWLTSFDTAKNEAAAKGREVISRGRETVATAVERGREAYQQARAASPSREGA